MRNRSRAALPTFLIGWLTLLTFYHWSAVWAIRLATLFATASLVLAIPQNSWMWGGVALLALSMATARAWTEGKGVWAVVSLATLVLCAPRLLSRLRARKMFENTLQWPLTQGRFAAHYEAASERILYYEYQVNGSYYSGSLDAGSTLRKELKSRLDVLKGKTAFVRYKPDQPEVSTLLKSDQPELPV